MLLVTIALAMASIMAAALLSSSALRAQTAATASDGVTAAYLAESAMNIAMFYVQQPDQYAGSKPNGYYPGHTISLGTGAPGTVQTTVSYDSVKKLYTVQAEATLIRGGQAIKRRATAVVEGQPVPPTLIQTPRDALISNSDVVVTSGARIRGANGSVRTRGRVTISSGGAVEGAVTANELVVSGGGVVSDSLSTSVTTVTKLSSSQDNLVTNSVTSSPYVGTAAPAVAPPAPTDLSRLVPAFSNMPDYRTYKWTDSATGITTTYVAKKLTKNNFKNEVLGPTSDNPAGIFWTDAATELHGGVTVNGTIIVTADVAVTVSGGNNFINAQAGLPGLVSAGALTFKDSGELGVNGLVYAQRLNSLSNVKNVILKVAGAVLLADTTNALATDQIAGLIAIGHESTRASVPGFGYVVPNWQNQSLRIVSWTEK